MKRYLQLASLLIITLSAASCSPYVNVVDVQMLTPSDSTVSFNGKRVAIVGNLYYANPAKGSGGGYLFDSTQVAQATVGIKATLEQSPVFEGYSIPIFYSYAVDTSLVGKPISKADADTLAKNMGADMLISVEYMNIEAHGGTYYEGSSEFMMEYTSLFRIYEAGKEQRQAQYLLRSNGLESINFHDANGYVAAVNYKEAEASLARRLGEDYALRLAPYWENVQRVYYLGPDDANRYLGRADTYAQNSDWSKAMELWNKALSESPNKKVVAMAAFNMGLGCEMLGDLELAKSWLEYCKKQDTNINPDSYMRVISKRIEDKKLLDKKLQGK